MSDSAAIAALTLGLEKLRKSWGYTETVKKSKKAGQPFAGTLLGQAETALMTSPPTRPAIDRGRDLLRGSWAWNKTRILNVVPAVFSRTLIAQADALFATALAQLPVDTFGVFSGNGVFCINWDGGVENSEEFRAGGFTLAAYNLGDHPLERWDNWHRRMAHAGISTGPWGRCYDPMDSRDLCAAAVEKGESWVVHNIERELDVGYRPPELEAVVREFPQLRHALLPEPWIQNNANLHPLAALGVVVITESYMNADPRFSPAPLAYHARDLGARLVGAAFGAGTWGDAPYDVPPATYFQEWPTGPYWVYPIDSKDARLWRRP